MSKIDITGFSQKKNSDPLRGSFFSSPCPATAGQGLEVSALASLGRASGATRL